MQDNTSKYDLTEYATRINRMIISDAQPPEFGPDAKVKVDAFCDDFLAILKARLNKATRDAGLTT